MQQSLDTVFRLSMNRPNFVQLSMIGQG